MVYKYKFCYCYCLLILMYSLWFCVDFFRHLLLLCFCFWNFDGWVATLDFGNEIGQIRRFDKARCNFEDTLDIVLHLCNLDRRVQAGNALLEPGLIRWDLVTQLALFIFWSGSEINLWLELSDAIGSLLAVVRKLLALAPSFPSVFWILDVYLGYVKD